MLKLITVIFFGLTSLNSFAAQYEVKPNESQISFKARGKPSFISINGQAPAAKGSLTEMDNVFSGEVLIDTNKITTGIDLRDSHLKDNYLEVAKFPMAKVTFNNVRLQDKESDLTPLARVVREKVSHVFLIGKDAGKLASAFGEDLCSFSESLESAIASAYAQSQSGDVVLLAPACASFDMFANYEERGNRFVKAVGGLSS